MKELIVASMLAALALPWVSFAQARLVLPEGTPIRMRMNRTVSSADAQVGDNVDFETLDDVNLGEMVVVPKGSMAMATITEAVPKRRMARGGKLGMNIDYVRLPTGGETGPQRRAARQRRRAHRRHDRRDSSHFHCVLSGRPVFSFHAR
jgi:hypothetical protein